MEALLAVLATAALAGVVVLGVALARAGRRPAAPAVPIESVVREAVAARSSADQAVLAGAVDQLVRMNQEMLDGRAPARCAGARRDPGARSTSRWPTMRTELARLTGVLHEVERERREHVGELSGQLREAGRQTQVLAETTQSLREALSSTTARGQWGERMAEDVLRLAGFVDGVNYRRHQPMRRLRRHPRLHVPAAAGPVAPHGRQVPAQQLPAPSRRVDRHRARPRTARSSSRTCACA